MVGISLSESLLQEQLTSYILKSKKLPMEWRFWKLLAIKFAKIPKLSLIEEHDKIYATLELDAAIFNSNNFFPIHFNVSFVPRYDVAKEQVFISNVKIENFDLGLIPDDQKQMAMDWINSLLTTESEFLAYDIKNSKNEKWL